MSMILDLTRLNDDQARELLDWSPPDPRAVAKSVPWWARLLIGVPTPERPVPDVSRNNRFSLEKEWHGVHFLLTGTADEAPFPMGFLETGGVYLSHTDRGYGEARWLAPELVAELHAFLDPISTDALLHRYDPKAMAEAEVYQAPRADDEQSVRAAISYFGAAYGPMRRFVAGSANAGCSLLIELT